LVDLPSDTQLVMIPAADGSHMDDRLGVFLDIVVDAQVADA
jgi:hypothetical protein